MPVRGLIMRCPGHLDGCTWTMLQKVVKQLKKSNGVWERKAAVQGRGQAPVGPRDTKEVEKVVFRRSDGLSKKKDVKYLASPLAWETIYMAWGSHMSNFHRVTQYGAKICHGS